MRLPRRIADILKRKQDFIDSQRGRLENTVVGLQSRLFNDILDELIPELDAKNGFILETAKNYRLISMLDKTYKSFQSIANRTVLNQIITGTSKIAEMNSGYFSTVLSSNMPARFESIVLRADKLINLRLGIDGGVPLRGGFLESLLNNNTAVITEIKQMTSKAITSGVGMKEYTKSLKEMITGTDMKAGSLDRQMRGFAYDLYQQYDRAYARQLAHEFGFTYFIYRGGLIEDSREFCIEHNDKVYSEEEAEQWKTWVSPTSGERPSYMNYPGYDPILDFGGYRCRHVPGYIPDELAKKMRPDIE